MPVLDYPFFPVLGHLKRAAVDEPERYYRGDEYYRYYRAHAKDEVHESKAGGAPYHDVRRVAYEGSRAAYVRHEYLGDEVGIRGYLKLPCYEERYRNREKDGSYIV